jgi:hypothetical protein
VSESILPIFSPKRLEKFLYTVKVSFLTRDRERNVHVRVTDICQNDRNEKLYKKNSRVPGHAPRTAPYISIY